MMDREKMIL